MTGRGKIIPAVGWHEGMLLSPQHFQQNHERLEGLMAYQAQLLTPYPWGVNAFTLDPIALVGGLVRITTLEAILPDGLYVGFDPQKMPALELDLKKEAPTLGETPVPVYVVVGAYREGDANATGDFARYMSVEGDPVVDENTGDKPLSIPRLLPKVTLFAGERPPAHGVALPVAHVALVDGAYALVDFVPPSLRVPLASPLGSLCVDLLGRMRAKVAFLMGQAKGGAGEAVMGDIRSTLRTFVPMLPYLETLVYSGLTHPFTLFGALAHVAGYLSTLRLGAMPPVFDFYAHEDLLLSFKTVISYIDTIVDSIQDGYQVIPLEKMNKQFLLNVQPNLVAEALVMGVKAPKGVTHDHMEAWIKDAVIASESVFKNTQDRRILGAKRKIIEGDESLRLVPGQDVVLFAVVFDQAFIKVGERLILQNASDEEGLRPENIVLYTARERDVEHVA